jgi:thiaminase/transcriptional activator TenA
MPQRFTERLRRRANSIWEAQHKHPFVYARLLALATARSPDLETMTRFAALTSATLETEMNLHRAYAADFAIDEKEMERETKAPTTQAYTDFLLRVAAMGDFTELVAALLPCIWGFSEIGLRLAGGPRPADERYARFIDMYAAPEFAELADWCRELVDRLADDLPERHLERLEEAFLLSSRYELAFWEMAWRGERWPC